MSEEFEGTRLSKREQDDRNIKDAKRKVIFFLVCVILMLIGKFVFGF
jgi:hypothetical protein